MKNTLTYKIIGDSKQNQKFYFDFVIDGKNLSELLGVREGNMIGVIGASNHDNYEKEKISELLLEKKSDLEEGRVMIYGCGECLDIGCGAITVKIEKVNDTIIWKEFAYENGYSETDFEEYKKIGLFVFEQKAYQNVFTEIGYCID